MEKLKVVFDDHCPTCTVGKNVSERLDTNHAIEFVGMNTEEGKRIISIYHLDMNTSAYAIKDGEVIGKSAMVRRVLEHNGLVGVILSVPFYVPWLGDRLYDLLARHRAHITSSIK